MSSTWPCARCSTTTSDRHAATARTSGSARTTSNGPSPPAAAGPALSWRSATRSPAPHARGSRSECSRPSTTPRPQGGRGPYERHDRRPQPRAHLRAPRRCPRTWLLRDRDQMRRLRLRVDHTQRPPNPYTGAAAMRRTTAAAVTAVALIVGTVALAAPSTPSTTTKGNTNDLQRSARADRARGRDYPDVARLGGTGTRQGQPLEGAVMGINS